mmetsp:Transcript_52520/g.128353  ORF Transcript_52520/g.128353 Transcript_52520/m.128353 type:complete len:329 (-) Transcript_52520:168-1154(-)
MHRLRSHSPKFGNPRCRAASPVEARRNGRCEATSKLQLNRARHRSEDTWHTGVCTVCICDMQVRLLLRRGAEHALKRLELVRVDLGGLVLVVDVVEPLVGLGAVDVAGALQQSGPPLAHVVLGLVLFVRLVVLLVEERLHVLLELVLGGEGLDVLLGELVLDGLAERGEEGAVRDLTVEELLLELLHALALPLQGVDVLLHGLLLLLDGDGERAAHGQHGRTAGDPVGRQSDPLLDRHGLVQGDGLVRVGEVGLEVGHGLVRAGGPRQEDASREGRTNSSAAAYAAQEIPDPSKLPLPHGDAGRPVVGGPHERHRGDGLVAHTRTRCS